MKKNMTQQEKIKFELLNYIQKMKYENYKFKDTTYVVKFINNKKIDEIEKLFTKELNNAVRQYKIVHGRIEDWVNYCLLCKIDDHVFEEYKDISKDPSRFEYKKIK